MADAPEPWSWDMRSERPTRHEELAADASADRSVAVTLTGCLAI